MASDPSKRMPLFIGMCPFRLTTTIIPFTHATCDRVTPQPRPKAIREEIRKSMGGNGHGNEAMDTHKQTMKQTLAQNTGQTQQKKN